MEEKKEEEKKSSGPFMECYPMPWNSQRKVKKREDCGQIKLGEKFGKHMEEIDRIG